MITIHSIDYNGKSIHFEFLNSIEGKSVMTIVIESIVAHYFGYSSSAVSDWVGFQFPIPNDTRTTATFTLH